MKVKDSQIYLVVGITLFLMFFLPNIRIQNFAISDSDFIYSSSVPLLSYSIDSDNATITFSWIEGINNTLVTQDIFYTIDNSSTISMSIPDPTGTHTINKFKVYIDSDNVTVKLDKWQTVYTKQIQTQNVTVNVTGPTVYENVTVYQNRTVNQTVYVPQEVPAEMTFTQQYGLAIGIFVIMGFIIIYMIGQRTR